MSPRTRRVHASAIVASLCTALATPTHARAQDPVEPALAPAPAAATPDLDTAGSLGDDEVLLRGGGFVRGTVVEVTPNVRAVIVVSGERREIPWDDIVEVQRGKHAAAWAPRIESPEAQPPEPEPSIGRPRIHLEPTRPRPVTLFEIDSEIVAGGYGSSMYGMNYRSVCTAPCDVVIDGSRGQQFFLGSGEQAAWTASRMFTLANQDGPLTIRVKPGNRGLRIAGAILLGLGIGGTVGGTVLAISRNTRPAGLIMLAVSVPAFIGGIPMLVFGRTRYELGDRIPTDDRDPADGP